MRTYVKNILLYIAALLGLLAFVALFSNALQSYDSVKDSWFTFNVKTYLGESIGNEKIYQGAVLPIFGFIIPLLLAIALIIESFHPSWLKSIKVINTIFAILFFVSAIMVLLTKEIFLNTNDLGDTTLIRNGFGPIFSACCSLVAAILVLLVTWIPSTTPMKFIEK